jgi:hypothetical protein
MPSTAAIYKLATAKKRRYRQRLRDGVIIVGVPVTNEILEFHAQRCRRSW